MQFHYYRVLSLAVVFSTLPLFGQIASTGNNPQPYTAETKTTVIRTLGDGTTITQTEKHILMRDSQGRTRQEKTYSQPPEFHTRTDVSISDPVEGTEIHWNSLGQVAKIIKEPPADQRTGCWTSDEGGYSTTYGGNSHPKAVNVKPAATRPPRPDIKREGLGTEMVMGVEAHGQRTTETIPVGAQGNDNPIRIVNETWSATGFNFLLHQIIDDPLRGKQVSEVTSLSLAEPDVSEFQPPPDMKTETSEMRPCPFH